VSQNSGECGLDWQRERARAAFAFVDRSTTSGVDRRVSIRTTSAPSPTRAHTAG